ncbi:MAG: hypothetical protein R2771_03425 [Saprospiraceae bacterium]
MRRTYILLAVLLLLSFGTFAQLSVIELYGAKSTGIASVNSVNQDINSIYTNPAGLSKVDGLSMIFGMANQFETIELSSVDFGIAKGLDKFGVFGIGIKKFGFNEYGEFQLSANYARALGSSFFIGTRFNYYNLTITGYGNESVVNADVGLQYFINEKLLFGINLINPFPVNFVGDVDMPTILQAGISYLLSDNLKLHTEIEKHIDYDYMLKFALEYSPLDAFTIYAGYRNDFEQFSDYSFGFRYDMGNNFSIVASTFYNLTYGLSPAVSVISER